VSDVKAVSPKTSAFCLNSRRWLLFMNLDNKYPSTCIYDAIDGDCDNCPHFTEKKVTAYFKRKWRVEP